MSKVEHGASFLKISRKEYTSTFDNMQEKFFKI